MPAVPVLSQEQKREGFERSLQLRRARAQVKSYLGTQPPQMLFTGVWYFDEVQGMKVFDLLKALPGIGPKTAASLLEQAGMGRNLTVANSGPRQRERLFLLLDSKKPRQ